MTVVFQNEVIGAREILSAFGLLNGNEVTLDWGHTLPVLIEALCESKRTLNTFRIISDQGDTPLELYSRSRGEFNITHESRFKYISEDPVTVSTEAFWKALGVDNDNLRLKVTTLMREVRKLDISGLKIDKNNLFGRLLLSVALQPIVAYSYRLEELILCPSVDMGNTRRLQLSHILRNRNPFCHLRYLELHHVESPGSLLVEVLTKCSRSLIDVMLSDSRIAGTESWSDVLCQLRTAEWPVLNGFVLCDYDGTEWLVNAQNYLKRLTHKNPIGQADEANED